VRFVSLSKRALTALTAAVSRESLVVSASGMARRALTVESWANLEGCIAAERAPVTPGNGW
jgi:hypothetical protein